MKSTRFTKRPALAVTAAVLTLVLLTLPAAAFLLPVVDVESIAEAIEIYNTAKSQLDVWQTTLKGFSSKSAWKSLGLKLLHTNITNTRGETAGLSSAINGNPSGVDQAWKSATLAMNGTGYLNGETVGQSGQLANTASIEMTDGFANDSLTAIATYRQMEPNNANAIEDLQARADSTSDGDNTLTAQQNLTNAALMQSIKLQQSVASMDAAILEQLTVQNSWQRNAATAMSNMYAASAQAAFSNPSSYINGGSTLVTYVLP